ncbi:16S rRNA processing protein RimM [Sporolactobacillus inulinus]|uniref:16S rRNA processing protein RimM n=1 Tax=Sporolactobacillus inulinus TaxID=2078 RepID=A0A4Y1Z650_9BACL|nr:16S rRNA processing protein RimM [Sporolactobacillus inulinus]
MADQWLYVGKIVNTQGIRGEVRVISATDLRTNAMQKVLRSMYAIRKTVIISR